MGQREGGRTSRASQDYREHTDEDTLFLKGGWNQVLLKVIKGSGPWLFSCRFVSADGRPLVDMKSKAQQPITN